MKRISRLRSLLLSLFCGVIAVSVVQAQEIAITIDDLPAHSALPSGDTRLEIATEIIKALKDAHVPPTYGFVNGIRVKEVPSDAAVLDAWREQGNPLGNHTWSHMSLNANTAEQFEADVLQNESIVHDRMAGQDWKWLRFPYLQEGDTQEKRMEVRRFLAQHGYRIAAVTMSFGDYLWNEPYARCVDKGDTKSIHMLEESYLHAADEEADYEVALSKLLDGHNIPYVLLMHIGAFDARMFSQLLALYQQKGFHFVTLAEAEKDPFYAGDVDLSLPPGPSNLTEAAAFKHIPVPPRPKHTDSLDTICR